MKYYICETCGNIIEKINDSGVPVVCCGKPMKELIPGTVDASFEKHVPQFEMMEKNVKVFVNHVMEDDHYIEYIALDSDRINAKKYLKPGEMAKAVFPYVPNSKLYAYCNKHGIWSTDVK